MADYICPQHQQPFATKQLLVEHMALEHKIKVNPAMVPSAEFVEQVKRIETPPKQVPAPQNMATAPQTTPPFVKKPLVLKYHWDGECPVCGRAVKTIEVENEGYNTVIAYCPFEDSQLKDQRVVAITKQFQKEEKNVNVSQTHISSKKEMRAMRKAVQKPL